MSSAETCTVRGVEDNGFTTPAVDAVRFKLTRNEADLEDFSRDSFPPGFTHQHFENESIFGYKNPEVRLLYSAWDLNLYVSFKHEGTVTEIHPDISPDDVMKLLSDQLPFPFETNLNDFSKTLEQRKRNFKPPGNLINSYKAHSDKGERTFCIYKVDSVAADEKFVELYKRMESFSLWFIDAASYTDTEDEKWNYYVLYEKYRDGSQDCFAFVGYASVYDYYAYPEHVRPRIGHILILPPFQRCGNGVRLLQAIYSDLVPNPKVLDITGHTKRDILSRIKCSLSIEHVTEDPSDNFIRLRDFVDCLNCSELNSFGPGSLMNGFSKEMKEEARQKLKLSTKQIRRVYEILRLKYTDCASDEEMKRYRLDVKKRLYAPFKDKKMDMNKLSKALNPEEFVATLASMAPEQRFSMLEKMFQETMEDYRYTLNRLATYSNSSTSSNVYTNGVA